MKTPITARAFGLALVVGLAIPASALPIGYKEDFNGCALNSADEQDRDRCCQETLVDCQTQCQKDNPNDANAAIVCDEGCLDATLKCKKGETVHVIWPGQPGLEVPGIRDESGGIKTTDGARFEKSPRSMLVELHNAKPTAGAECLQLRVSCESASPGRGKAAPRTDCYPEMSASQLDCRPHDAKKSDEKLCRPVVLSIEACTP